MKLPRYYKDKIFDDDEKRLIRELNFIRLNEKDTKIFKYSFEPGAVRALKDEQERIRTFKRIYYKKSLKQRKDL